MARGNTIGQLCLLLLVSCSSLLFMQYPACATAALSAQQAQPAAAAAAASAAALQALNTLKRVSLAGNPMVNSRAFGAVQDSRNWNTLATKLTKPGAHTKEIQNPWGCNVLRRKAYRRGYIGVLLTATLNV
jgi:hypothetical protein